MRHWIQVDGAGKILARGTSPVGLDDSSVAHIPGAILVTADDAVATHYKNGQYMTAPASPGPGHVFDDVSFAWIFDSAVAASAARVRRAELLADSDWTQLPDAPETSKAAWADYRQALRDITDQSGFPQNILWPTAPGQH